MSHPDADELRVLRARAYGPGADIHLDEEALQRLTELEARSRGVLAPPTVGEDDDTVEPSPLPATDDPVPSADEVEEAPAVEPRRPAFRVRRSTLFMALALVALLVASYAAVVLVQRVQSDPLGADASQIARLAPDGGYEIPAIFSNGSAEPGASQSYQEFHGLRVITTDLWTELDDVCILVYPADSVTDGEGFTGPAYSACAAGDFPAAVAFRVTSDLPDQLRDAFPDDTALQFVLDESRNEIVVFADE